MCGSTQEVRIDITGTRTPVLRAGLGNMLLFFAVIASFMLDALLTDLQASFVYRILCIVIIWLAFAKLYLRYVSQVCITKDRELTLETPLRSTRMKLAHIERITIYTVPTSKTAILWINRRGKALPALYFFVAVYTHCGMFRETVDKLSAILEKVRGSDRDQP